MIGVDSTASVGTKIWLTSSGTDRWTYAGVYECKWCGDKNCPRYIKGACWKCWRNRNPGALE